MPLTSVSFPAPPMSESSPFPPRIVSSPSPPESENARQAMQSVIWSFPASPRTIQFVPLEIRTVSSRSPRPRNTAAAEPHVTSCGLTLVHPDSAVIVAPVSTIVTVSPIFVAWMSLVSPGSAP